jgi:hypothetical protein
MGWGGFSVISRPTTTALAAASSRMAQGDEDFVVDVFIPVLKPP